VIATLNMLSVSALAVSHLFAVLAHSSDSLRRNPIEWQVDRLGKNRAEFGYHTTALPGSHFARCIQNIGEARMTYSIIGAGSIGSALAAHFVRFKIPVQIASNSDVTALQSAASKMGPDVKAVSVAKALQCDMVFLAVPFDAVTAVITGARSWNGRIVVDCTNAVDFPAFRPRDLGGRPSSEFVADLVRGARLVKAFNTLPAAILALPAGAAGGHRVVFLSGDDDSAKTEVSELATLFGFAPIDLGTLSAGGRLQQFGGPLVVHNLIKLP
jgi:predicted dinucleotide-binding enzyme